MCVAGLHATGAAVVFLLSGCYRYVRCGDEARRAGAVIRVDCAATSTLAHTMSDKPPVIRDVAVHIRARCGAAPSDELHLTRWQRGITIFGPLGVPCGENTVQVDRWDEGGA